MMMLLRLIEHIKGHDGVWFATCEEIASVWVDDEEDRQKCGELALLRDALNSGETAALEEWSAPIQARRHSRRVHNAAVEKRLAAITAQDSQRENPYEVRAEAQRARFKLPAWPTTTIGSFPQTTEIRGLRLDFKKGNLDANHYRTGIAEHIKQAIIEQEL